MAAAERIDKYHEDILALIDSNKDSLGSEISKLSKWLLKHQDELLPDSQKNKLFTIVQRCYKLVSEKQDINPVLKGKVQALIEDLCKMPVGKLVTMKSKKQGAKYLDFFNEERTHDTSALKEYRYQVVDVDEKLILLMDPLTFDNVEHTDTTGGHVELSSFLSEGEDVFIVARLDKDDNIVSYELAT